MPRSQSSPPDPAALRALMHWYQDMSVDCVTGDGPCDFYSDFSDQPGNVPGAVGNMQAKIAPGPKTETGANPLKTPSSRQPSTGILRADPGDLSADEAISKARILARNANTIEELDKAVREFDGCPLKKGARSTVFYEGNLSAPLMVMGEAPGRDEDRIGKPFVGRAGVLLDKMLDAIGQSRQDNTLISNVIYWRPPGNRAPSDEEIMMCQPFAERLIALVKPKVLMVAGASPLKAMLGKTGIMKNRGRWHEIVVDDDVAIPVMPTFHPAYLLRNPAAKAQSWEDLKLVREALRKN